MKPLSLMLFAALLTAAGASQAGGRGDCPERGRCRVAPVAPVPPIPPVPGVAPLAPIPPIAPVSAVAPLAPIPPMPPMPPANASAPMAPMAAMAPPPPPALPDVPNAAHDACLGKAIGARMTYHPRKGVTMRGTCQKDSKGMYFEVQEYRSVN